MGRLQMWVSKISEIIGSSTESFEDAAARVVARAHRSLEGIHGIEVMGKSLKVKDDAVLEYRVKLRLIFDVVPHIGQHW